MDSDDIHCPAGRGTGEKTLSKHELEYVPVCGGVNGGWYIVQTPATNRQLFRPYLASQPGGGASSTSRVHRPLQARRRAEMKQGRLYEWNHGFSWSTLR